MKLESILKYARSLAPEESVWRSNVNGDNDYFSMKIVDRDTKSGVAYGHVLCTTSIGFARYGNWKQFKVKLKNGLTKEQINVLLKDYLAYYNDCVQARKSYADGFKNYVQSTGGHRGNPVWMD